MKSLDKPTLSRLLAGLLLGMLALLQVRLWVSSDGFSEVSRLRNQVVLQSWENEQLAGRNRRLEAEVGDLKRGFTAVEERARSDLGLISPEESFYVFGDSQAREQLAGARR